MMVNRIVTAGAAAGLALGLVAAPAAAYPPGAEPEVFTNHVRYKPSQKVKAKVAQVQAGCRVKFTFAGYNFKKVRRSTANSKGIAKAKVKKGPKTPAKYKVLTKTYGKGCVTERAKVTFRVVKKKKKK
jgi:hypothetical protein